MKTKREINSRLIWPNWKVICCSLWREWEGGEVRWPEGLPARRWARRGAGTLWPWPSSREPAPAWGAGSRWSTRPLRGATRTCRPAPPAGPTASAWWCVSNRLRSTNQDIAASQNRSTIVAWRPLSNVKIQQASVRLNNRSWNALLIFRHDIHEYQNVFTVNWQMC